MQAQTKKTILICIASAAAALLLAALGWFLFFQSKFMQYQDAKYHFSLKYPGAWKMVRSVQPDVPVAFVSPKENALDVFQENVNINIQPVPALLASVSSFSDKITQQMTVVFKKNIVILENAPFTFGGRIGHRMVFDAPKPDNMRAVVVWTIKNEQAYILLFLGRNQSLKQYSPLVEEMIKSFQFK